MDETEEDASYQLIPHVRNHQEVSGSAQQPKLSIHNAPQPLAIDSRYADDDIDEDENDDDDDEDEDEDIGEEEDGNVENDGAERLGKDDENDSDDDDDGGGGDDDDHNEDGDEDDEKKKNYYRRADDGDLERHLKKRKLRNLISNYEFAPRFVAPSTALASALKLGGRNSLMDWTEHETFVLLDAWGDKFLQLGRKSLRSEEWQEVAEKVSEVSKIDRTDSQCRNRLDILKKKFKKEKMKLMEINGGSSKWVYFKKIDMLMSSTSRQTGFSCGLDSGEYVFMNPKVYLNRANGLDEMRDSPGNSESTAGKEDDLDGLPPKRQRSRQHNFDGSSFRLLADSIQKFGEIYEKIENSKRQQMVELEKMRMDFHRELELRKRQILEKAHVEVAKIHRGDDE